MEKKTKNIVKIIAIVAIGAVMVSGFLTNWFGLYAPDEPDTIVFESSEALGDLSSTMVNEYKKIAPDADIIQSNTTSAVSDVVDGSSTIALTTTPLSSGQKDADCNEFIICNTTGDTPVYIVWKGYPEFELYGFIQFMMTKTGREYMEGAGDYMTYAQFSKGALRGVYVRGSTTVFPIVSAAAELYEMFNPEVSIAVSATGSTDGKTAMNGTSANGYMPEVDFGMASSSVDTETYPNVINETVARDAICVVTSSGLAADLDLTIEQITKIFNGTITTWDQVDTGLPSDAINVYCRESGSGTRDTFEKFTGVGDEWDYADGATALASNGAVYDAVSSDPNAIGYIGIGYVDSGVKATDVEGVTPTTVTALNGEYPMSRDIYLLFRPDIANPPDISEDGLDASAQDFVDFIIDTDLGDWIIEYTGYIPPA
ncbi:MAG: hypothetical protein GF364_19630 [Candidatus Lokiarchaeota archaeon]|nr:hypothetical protein [Candidatus Lokiarchaeota archaeon]